MTAPTDKKARLRKGETLTLTDRVRLFGRKSGKRSDTHWICFMNTSLPTGEPV